VSELITKSHMALTWLQLAWIFFKSLQIFNTPPDVLILLVGISLLENFVWHIILTFEGEVLNLEVYSWS